MSYIHKVQYYETDMMGVVHHSNYIRWFEEARIEFFNKLGFSYREIEKEGKISPILGVSCKYIDSVYFDDLVIIKVRVKKKGSYKLILGYEVIDESTNKLKAIGESQQGFMDDKGNILSLKKDFSDLYEKLSV